MASPAHLDLSNETTLTFHSESVDDTLRLGAALATVLQAGDLVCITGPLGAGKSELCRAIIRARMGDDDLEVPSPSYTLVNVYDHPDGELWHADLYRIGDASELHEIGLEDATGSALVLVEWPERWPDLPARRMDVTIEPDGADMRIFTFAPSGSGWADATACLKALT